MNSERPRGSEARPPRIEGGRAEEIEQSLVERVARAMYQRPWDGCIDKDVWLAVATDALAELGLIGIFSTHKLVSRDAPQVDGWERYVTPIKSQDRSWIHRMMIRDLAVHAWNIFCRWAKETVAAAAPTCTLWCYSMGFDGFVFRPWPRWRMISTGLPRPGYDIHRQTYNGVRTVYF